MEDDRPPDRRHLDDLLDAMLPFAHQMLDKNGEFFPFGAAMGRAGRSEERRVGEGCKSAGRQKAEDGIRDTSVTGVQTCALPIWMRLDIPVATRSRGSDAN